MVVLFSLQHLLEQLDLDLSPLEYMMKCYPEIKEKEEMRKIIGRYGLTGKQQVSPIRNLSDGQKCRVYLTCWPGRTLTCCFWTSLSITWTSRPLMHWQMPSVNLRVA